MMEINGSKAIGGALYISNCKFGNVLAFRDFIMKEFNNIPFEKKEIVSKIEEYIDTKSHIVGEIGQKDAKNLLIIEDLKNIKDTIISNPLEDPFKSIDKYVNKYCEKINKIGIELDDVKTFIVEKFPKPFENAGGTAINFDVADKRKYGIEEGIYFKEDRILPYSTQILASHEIIHRAASMKHPHLLARGIEDGICDYVGILYICREIIGSDACKNLVFHLRFRHHPGSDWNRYTTNLQQAAVLYINYGFESLIEIIKEGRILMEDVEKKLFLGKIDEIPIIKKGNWIEDITNFSYRILTYEKTLVVSPLALLIAKNINSGDNIKSFFRDNNIKEREGAKAIEELYETHFVLISDGEKITCDRSKLYLDAGVMRYFID